MVTSSPLPQLSGNPTPHLSAPSGELQTYSLQGQGTASGGPEALATAHAECHKMAAASLCLNLAPPLGLTQPPYSLSSISHSTPLDAGLLPKSWVRNAEAQIHTPSKRSSASLRPAPVDTLTDPASTKWRTSAFSLLLFIRHAGVT